MHGPPPATSLRRVLSCFVLSDPTSLRRSQLSQDTLNSNKYIVFGYGQQYGYGHTGIRLVLPYHGYTGRRKKSHTVARMPDRGERVSPLPPPVETRLTARLSLSLSKF